MGCICADLASVLAKAVARWLQDENQSSCDASLRHFSRICRIWARSPCALHMLNISTNIISTLI